MKRNILPVLIMTLAAATFGAQVATAQAIGMAIGKDADALARTRISNSGGGAAGNPHWGAEPYQSPWSEESDVWEGENYGEAFEDRDSATYNGYALRGEDAPWDVDPGASMSQYKGGNATNSDWPNFKVPTNPGGQGGTETQP